MSFPQELKERKQWVCWRLEPDKDGGKPRKMPINPVTGKGAMSNNPNTWSDYQTAFEAYEKYGYFLQGRSPYQIAKLLTDSVINY